MVSQWSCIIIPCLHKSSRERTNKFSGSIFSLCCCLFVEFQTLQRYALVAFVSKEKLENDTGISKDKAGERKAHPVQNPGNNCFHSLTAKWGKHTNKMGPWKVQVVWPHPVKVEKMQRRWNHLLFVQKCSKPKKLIHRCYHHPINTLKIKYRLYYTYYPTMIKHRRCQQFKNSDHLLY